MDEKGPLGKRIPSGGGYFYKKARKIKSFVASRGKALTRKKRETLKRGEKKKSISQV